MKIRARGMKCALIAATLFAGGAASVLALQPGGANPAAPGAAIGDVRISKLNVKMTYGPGWQKMTADQIAEFTKSAQGMKGVAAVTYEDGYVLLHDNAPAGFLLLQVTDKPVASGDIDDIVNGILGNQLKDTVRDAQRQNPNELTGLQLNQPSFDPQRGSFQIPMQMQTGGEQIRGVTTGHIGTKGVLVTHAYTSADAWPLVKGEFDRVNNSVTFDAGSTFADAKATSGRAGAGPSKIMIYGLGGAVVAIIAAVAGKKKTQNAAPVTQTVTRPIDPNLPPRA